MKELIEQYLQAISSKFSHEETSEMGYRADFEILLKGVFATIKVSRFDHDARAKQGNKPDFVVLKNDVPILYIETKDIGVSLDKVEKSEQMSRYFGYANLVLTDYVEFRFYRNGLPYGTPIKIADYVMRDRTISPLPDNFENLARTLIEFTQSHKEPIRSGKHLAKIMGGKAQRIRDNVYQFLSNESDKNGELIRVYETIKKLLVHDLNEEGFADMYAQTLVYGLFVARFYDDSPGSFTRQEARDLIPPSNPLLRQFFDHIVGPNFDKRLEHIVNELCEVFSHADVEKLMNEYLETNLKGKTHRKQDTVIHFYEDFLNEYDPILRKKMGAYYTPLPVVEFIVRSVDQLLQKEFGLSQGLADTAKLSNGKHKVQVLDPAVGTGTFISAVIGEIYRKFKGQEGRWPAYVLHDLLPRIHGFELMIAPYTIAHLKLGMAFKETGFKYFNNRRLGIYLTNSLEQAPKQDSLFNAFGLAESIAEESKEASVIKNETPIMVVVGNPPYSVSSSNKGEWITQLIKVYKENLNEKNIQPLSDDYIKFIRFAEHFIEKNGSGIVAMITNNSYIDGLIHRQMRKHLLRTFDTIYVIDLHGNSKKKEVSPDGGKDENVFNIQQGVSISIMIRNKSEKNTKPEIKFTEVFGSRESKFDFLNINNIDTIKWKQVTSSEPSYYLIPKDNTLLDEYMGFISLRELMPFGDAGIKTHRDSFVIDSDKSELENRIHEFYDLQEHELRAKYGIKDTRDFSIVTSRNKSQFDESSFKKINYRPFDIRWVYYSKWLMDWPREKTMQNFIDKQNIGLVVCRQQSTFDFQHIFVTKQLVDMCAISLQTKETGYALPLYVYQADGSFSRNFDKNTLNNLLINITATYEPEDILDYIYAVLSSPSFRKKYKDFLKTDFPRIPQPKDNTSFQKLVALGCELREIHLLEAPSVSKFITTYSESGSDIVDKLIYKDNKVYINDTQYFGNVSELAWNFYIGGFQPAQKWLKDRKGRELTNEDIEHYQKIIVSLCETSRIMKQIDEVMKMANIDI